MESYRVRVGYPDGQTSVVDVSFSQLVQLVHGGPKRLPLEFYRAEESITNGKGENIKLLTPAV